MDTVELRSAEAAPPSIVVHPATGEVLDLAAGSADLVRWLQEVRQMESDIREVKRLVTHELIDRMDRDARYTLQVGDLEVKGDGPTPPTVWEAKSLRDDLQEYVEAGVITPDALDRAVERVEGFKPRALGIKALQKLGGGVAETIERHAHPKENYERRISIKEPDLKRKAVRS